MRVRSRRRGRTLPAALRSCVGVISARDSWRVARFAPGAPLPDDLLDLARGGWLCADSSCYSLLSLLFLAPWPATAAPPDNFRDQIDLPPGFSPEGIESGRGTSSSAPSLMARSGAATYALARAKSSRTALRAGCLSASPTRRVGTGCGLRVADPDSSVRVMCGSTTRPSAPCSRPSSHLGRSGSSTTWRSHTTRFT
jgi:hypothetical protein